uniref:Protein zwilch n=1 Tax=Diabrotica virgifera virgifera TaxID=50390 RepID=A0A6P7GEQ8_DIAVI
MICDYILKDLPSYLKDLLSDTDLDKVQLVCKKKSLNNENDFTEPVSSICKEEIDSEIKLDVTGSPLKVTLSGNESLNVEDVRIVQTWTELEAKQIPMTIQEARNYLNSRQTRNGGNLPVFVICDGCNPLKTVILGMQERRNEIFTCTVNILGCFSKSDEKVALSAMEKSHLLLTRSRKCKIDYIVTFKYFIFGSFLQNVKDIYSCEDSGSVCIETSVNKKCAFDNPCTLPDVMKINVQVITGHRNSSLFFLWDDLILLNNYIKLTSSVNKKNPEAEICNNPLSSEDVYNNLNDIVNTSLVKRELKSEFGLNNMRLPNIIDKLWSILKNCQDLRFLREAFHFFFEELAESTSNVRLPPEIDEFQRISTKYINLVQQLGDTIEKEKMKAIGARNILQSMEKQKENNQEQLQALISEKNMELERLKIQFNSLQKAEMEQHEIINQLTHC